MALFELPVAWTLTSLEDRLSESGGEVQRGRRAKGGARDVIVTRWSTEGDAEALARVHAEAWRYAYSGILPGAAIERRVATHGAGWWRAAHRSGGRALVVEMEGAVYGYARIGACRSAGFGRAGEIYELYLDPAAHGAGLGKRLFAEARRRLARTGREGLVVWSLAANEVGCRFYRALGGRPRRTGRMTFGGVVVDGIAYGWP